MIQSFGQEMLLAILNLKTGATIIVKNSDKENYMYKVYVKIFHSTGTWSFDNDSGVDNNL